MLNRVSALRQIFTVCLLVKAGLVMGGPPPEPSAFLLHSGGAQPALSGDGIWVAFQCSGASPQGLCIGNTETREVTEVVTLPAGQSVAHIAISRNGMVIGYTHSGSGPHQVWVYDRDTEMTEQVSVNSDEDAAEDTARDPGLSDDGRYVVFSSAADNLVENDSNGTWDVFIRDRQMGITSRVSLAFDGAEGDASSGQFDGPPSISAVGTEVAFNSRAENLVQGDIDDDDLPYEFDYHDAFLVDLSAETITRMSQVTGMFQGGDSSSDCSALSANGNTGAFVTGADNLIPGPLIEGDVDALLSWNRLNGEFTHINPPVFGDSQADITLKNGCNIELNHDGSIIYFTGGASNYVFGDDNGLTDVFAWQDGTLSVIRPIVDEEEFFAIDVSINNTGDAIALLASNLAQTSFGIVIMNRGDIVAPILHSVNLIPDGMVIQGAILDFEGVATDFDHGNSNIVDAEFNVDGGIWMPLPAEDGVYDSHTEAFHGFVDTGGLAEGIHMACARAQDATGFYSEEECREFEVVMGAIGGEAMLLCTHTPIWPQPGETVTISMSVVQRPEDDSPLVWFPVGRTEIWFNDPSEPVDVNDYFGTSSNIYDSEILEAGSFTYGCRARVGESSVFSGWRTVSVGDNGEDRPIPVVYTGPMGESLDLVFIADEDSYDSASDPDFLDDVRRVINTSFYTYGYYNRYQHMFNFWISKNMGGADRITPPGGETMKIITKPASWDRFYSFYDAAVVLHEDEFRDFAKKNRMFTVWSDFDADGGNLRVPRHEAGHSLFGLSDEYCCNTTHFESEFFPNVYNSIEFCEADAPNLGRDPEDCRSMTSDIDDETAYTSEPEQPDLMRNNRQPREADKRKIDWKFGQCQMGLC